MVLGVEMVEMACLKIICSWCPLPRMTVNLSKRELRELSRACGLPTADLPASACLSSRIPYGMEVTVEKLRQIDRAEDALRDLGYRQVRVRHHGELARVELAAEELPRALELTEIQRMSRALHDLGFRWVSLDLDGYRTGSLNEILTLEQADAFYGVIIETGGDGNPAVNAGATEACRRERRQKG